MLRRYDGQQWWYGPLPLLLSEVGVGLVVERSGQVALVNDRFCRLSGYTAAELLALQTVSSVFAPQDREVLIKGSAQRAAGGDEPRALQAAIVRPDGGRVPVAVSVHLAAGDGRPELVAASRWPVTLPGAPGPHEPIGEEIRQ